MDLLLEKRRGLDVAITAKEKARREATKKTPSTTADTTGNNKTSVKNKSTASSGSSKESGRDKEDLDISVGKEAGTPNTSYPPPPPPFPPAIF